MKKITAWEEYMVEHSYLYKDKNIQVTGGVPFSATRAFSEAFPRLTELLSRADIQEIMIDDEKFYFYSWQNKEKNFMGWLSPAQKSTDMSPYLCADHALLLTQFGGMTTTWNDPQEARLFMNHFFILTAKDAKPMDSADRKDLTESCRDSGMRPTVALSKLTVYAQEANGDYQMYAKKDGTVFYLAHDSDRQDLLHVNGFPDNTLAMLDNCFTLREWVEMGAGEWLEDVQLPK